jgi:hypothetical protein
MVVPKIRISRMDPLNVYDLCYNKFSQKTNMQKKNRPCTEWGTWPW